MTQAVRDENNGLSNGQQVNTASQNIHKQESEIQDKGYSTASVGKISTTESSEDDKMLWSQNQQKLFEKALASVPKDASDRWTQIARNVPGKNRVSVSY